ncbi:hypothetical protein ABIA96_003714 [Bradyrhizobium sp. LB11.1]
MPNARSRGNLFDLKNPKRSRIVQMNVHIHTAFLRDAKHDIEMFFNVAIPSGRVYAADEICAGPDRRIEQFRSTGVLRIPFCGKATS